MKCITCGTDNKWKERKVSGRCKQCNHRFTFEPITMRGHPKFTDAFFQKAIADISINNTLSFTLSQFHYFIDRRLKRKAITSIYGSLMSYVFLFIPFVFCVSFVLIILSVELENLWIIWFAYHLIIGYFIFKHSNSTSLGASSRQSAITNLKLIGGLIAVFGLFQFFTGGQSIYWLIALVGLATLILGIVQQRRTIGRSETFLVNHEQVRNWLSSWRGASNSAGKLLPPIQQTPSAQTVRSGVSPELTTYSFDRLVICQSDRIAQMLVANNFHFENSCAILSVSGYPQRIFDTTLQMLRRNQTLQVYVFHDCDWEGIALAHQIRNDPQWFPDENITIVDIGLSPSQILATKGGIFIQKDKAAITATARFDPAIRQGLSKADLQWLDAGNFVELASFTPRKLIQVLQQGIAKSQQMNLEGDSSLILNEASSGSGFLYTVDSFG